MNRTSTELPRLEPESSASTNSAMAAKVVNKDTRSVSKQEVCCVYSHIFVVFTHIRGLKHERDKPNLQDSHELKKFFLP